MIKQRKGSRLTDSQSWKLPSKINSFIKLRFIKGPFKSSEHNILEICAFRLDRRGSNEVLSKSGKYKGKVSTMVIQLQGITRNLKMCGAGLGLTMRKTTGDGVCCRNKMDLAFNQGLPGKHKSRIPASKKTPQLPQVLGEIVFGIHPVKLALQAGRRQPYKLYIKENTNTEGFKEIKQLSSKAGVKIVPLPKYFLDLLAEKRPHQGVCLDASQLELDYVQPDEKYVRSLMKTKENCPSLWLLLYMVKDPQNMGSILRSSYFFGADGVIFLKHDSCPLTSTVNKASSGVIEIMNLKTIASQASTVKLLKLWSSNGGSVMGTTCDTGSPKTVSVNDVTVNKPTLLILGNEADGLPEEILEHCDTHLHITSHTTTSELDSLNVSVAAGVVLHALTKSREKLRTLPEG